MKYVNKVILVGVIGADADEVIGADGKRRAYVSVGTRTRTATSRGEEVTRTDWHRVTVAAELLAGAGAFLRRDVKVYVEGEITYGSYERGGLSIPTADIVAKEIIVLRTHLPATAVGAEEAGQ